MADCVVCILMKTVLLLIKMESGSLDAIPEINIDIEVSNLKKYELKNNTKYKFIIIAIQTLFKNARKGTWQAEDMTVRKGRHRSISNTTPVRIFRLQSN